MRITRRLIAGGAAALLGAPALAAPSAFEPDPWVAYETRLRARLADAGGGRFDEAGARQVLALTNAAREAERAKPLAWHEELEAAARAHAADLVQRGYMEHLSPEQFDPSHRFWLLGRRTIGSPSENIAVHRGGRAATPADLMGIWRRSPGHWGNLLKASHTHAAFGLVRRGGDAFVVGLYARPLTSLSQPLPFRVQSGEALARTLQTVWDGARDLQPYLATPQGSARPTTRQPAGASRMFQVSARRPAEGGGFELIGGPIFLLLS